MIQSSFSSLRQVADVHYPALSWLVAKNKLDSKSAIKHFHGPLLISHARDDEVIPYALGQELFAAANQPKQLYTIEDAGHNDWLSREYLQVLDRFIDQLAGTKAQ